MADPFKNFMIGLFVVTAGAIIIFIILFLHPSIGDNGKLLHVRFTNIDKVNPGTRVTYAGKPVGEVSKIKEVEFGRSGPAATNGEIYLYELTLSVDTTVNVYNTDIIALRTSGLLGEKNVEITPMAPSKGEELIILDKEILFATETGSVEDTFKQIKIVGTRFNTAIDLVSEILENIKKQEIVEKVSQTLSNLESITGSLNQPENLADTLKNVHELSAHVNLLSSRALDTWTNVDKTVNDFDQMAIHGATITEKVSRGEGTIGKLLVNDELYLRTNSIMSKLETTLDDVNHYGLMFHSDKGWQRLRARRLNLLQTLRTPQEFRNYFNDEIDQINTSLSRVYMVLNEIGSDPYCTNIVENKEFSKVFAELLRRAAMFEEEVRMYNTQLVEVDVHQTELGAPPLCPQQCCGQEQGCH